MSSPDNYNQHIIEQFRASGGTTDYPGPLVLLTTTGVRSGQPRTTPVAYSVDGAHLVIIASAGGAPTHPDWYHNLVAHPMVTVELGSETFRACAQVVDGVERDRLYAQHAQALGFSTSDYGRNTTRQIPVITLALAASPRLAYADGDTKGGWLWAFTAQLGLQPVGCSPDSSGSTICR